MRGLTLIIALSIAWPVMAEDVMQPHESILSAIRQELESNFRQSEGTYEIDIAPLDKRLQLPLCPHDLKVIRQVGSRDAGHVSLNIRCDGTPGWSVYHRAYVRVYREVAVLRRSLKQGELVAASDLTLEKRDLAQLRGGGDVARPELAVGKPVRRSLSAGTVLNSDHLGSIKLIRRNQVVVIQASNPGFEISMNGIALMDGEIGQRIRVRNEVSKRIVAGTVVNEGVVNVSD
ncbi:flagellar basal body P-ring formation chaperone FlgA [Methylococcus sp. EFPC2]|uniref:flagellar basal body P-ring formation chaperone FlgA n=1 Tax=Methylococcus sp. EFPC2 TaxID=2812648 RepID=UPI0019683E1E|nr:flagellar basal body P-ring formation chaperone FlgA [Methylococcus sp. EFPC2]QSA98376.1 flagellar basal body P-ring formation protein FlgA [Methylococcus sp. EFPC2]